VQGLTAAQIYDERKYMINQQMANDIERNVAARVSANYAAPLPVNEEIGDARKGKYVTALGFAGTKPSRASGVLRSKIPSSVEAQTLEPPG